MSSSKQGVLNQETLDQVLERFGIQNWDWLLVGDGSGSNPEEPFGWASISIERLTFERRVWQGAMNAGTINLAEMLAYLQPLSWYAKQKPAQSTTGKKQHFRQVHIITDSVYCKHRGLSEDLMPKENAAWWRIFESFTRNGILIEWHWIERNDVDLNILVDLLSKDMRKLIKGHQPAAGTKTVYDYNPAH